jgi:hypothetical protein
VLAVKIKRENKIIILVSIATALSFSILSFYPLFAIRPYTTLSFDIASPDLAASAIPNMTMGGVGPCGIDPRNLSCIPAPCEQIPPPQFCLYNNTDMHNNTNNNSNSTAFYIKGLDMPTPSSEADVASIGTRIYTSLLVPLKL